MARLMLLAAVSTLSTLAACAPSRGLLMTVGPDYKTPPLATPAAWQAPLPHSATVEGMRDWWRRFDDPILLELLEAAQREGATVAQAAARIQRARADAVAADATAWPGFDALVQGSRSAFSFGGPAMQRDMLSVGAQTTWELDLFGGRARDREAARAGLQSASAAWHDARVALAAETANAYVNLRACERQRELTADDARSREESLRLTMIAGEAGFRAPADMALARAVAAEGRAALAQRAAQCEAQIKALVALTALEEVSLRERLARGPGATPTGLPVPASFSPAAVPADVLWQRPDVAGAERDLAAASARVGVAEAQRWPSVNITGNILPTRMRIDGSPAMNITTWTIGPNLNLPIFDAGRRRAAAAAAVAEYEAAGSAFRAKVRTAVREVEEALVQVRSTQDRLPDARVAADGYRESFEAAEVRQRAGLGSMIEAEQARRTALGAELAVAGLEQEAAVAWIALYRAAGGAWEGPAQASPAVPGTHTSAPPQADPAGQNPPSPVADAQAATAASARPDTPPTTR